MASDREALADRLEKLATPWHGRMLGAFQAVCLGDACFASLPTILDALRDDRGVRPGMEARAEAIARAAHAGQTDKAGAPYAGHLGRVAARAKAHAEAMGLAPQTASLCAQVGWLHDVIEDTDATSEDLVRAGFGTLVAWTVLRLTRSEGLPYADYVSGLIASGDQIALIVKLADAEDNADPSRGRPPNRRYLDTAEKIRAALYEGRSDG